MESRGNDKMDKLSILKTDLFGYATKTCTCVIYSETKMDGYVEVD